MTGKATGTDGAAGEVPTPPWWGEARSGRTRPTLTRQEIVETAVRLVDEEGLAALSMRRLGKALGTAATSLYWHVPSKEALLDLVLDAVLGEMDLTNVPGEGPWRGRVAAVTHEFHQALLRHPRVVPVLNTGTPVGPNGLPAIETLLGILRQAGFSDADAVAGHSTLVNFTIGFAMLETSTVTSTLLDEDDRQQRVAQFSGFIGSLPRDRFPNLVEVAPSWGALTLRERYEFGIETILDGLEAALARR